jgi:hypothetical protein
VAVTLLVGDGPVAAGVTCSPLLDATSVTVTFDATSDAGNPGALKGGPRLDGGGPDTGSIIPGTRSACVSELAQFPLTTNNFAPAGSGPNGITSGPGSNTNSLWFTLQFANQIGEISTDGTFLQSFTVPTPASQPYGIVAGSDGDIYFTEYVGGKVGAPKIPTELASQR